MAIKVNCLHIGWNACIICNMYMNMSCIYDMCIEAVGIFGRPFDILDSTVDHPPIQNTAALMAYHSLSSTKDSTIKVVIRLY